MKVLLFNLNLLSKLRFINVIIFFENNETPIKNKNKIITGVDIKNQTIL